ncbi:O-antigen/teichoic acid export membrane protein [Herbihabitans rhizosphaerae]|uniref:O-antigen/teichoic acid export membrane protein n=1 Tax=Herbihabitans rhizosphaerae TaxID=1872711 RepID=A0A4Q7L545_9PSEU|nr:polysaccharide biosynthesis protein [Herbihabitans rhizosphaerae]RZS44768.1 O-antigen/teichoic acid export membrane protein [Herbihabitans rhizosphaerae]
MTRAAQDTVPGERAPNKLGLEAVAVSVALAASNAAAYVLTVIAARVLAPSVFGEFSSLFALLVVGAVPAMGLQTVVALRVARGRREGGEAFTLGLIATAGVTAFGFAMVPVLVALLHLDGPAAALVVAGSLAPLTLLGVWHGVLQGTRRFGTLAGLVALEGAGKIGGALTGLFTTRTPTGALIGTAAGMLLAAVVGWVLCGRSRPVRGGWRGLGEVAHAGQAMLALVLLVNLDLVLARHALPAHEAGEYAVGAVVTKIAYWLPQAVGVLVLPRLADAENRRRTVAIALAVCAALDAVVIAVAALFGDTVVSLIGGAGYAGADLPVAIFALVGSLLAAAQILLFSRIASADRRSTLLLWLAVALEIVLVLAWWRSSITEVVAAAAVATAVLAVVGSSVEYRHVNDRSRDV